MSELKERRKGSGLLLKQEKNKTKKTKLDLASTYVKKPLSFQIYFSSCVGLLYFFLCSKLIKKKDKLK